MIRLRRAPDPPPPSLHEIARRLGRLHPHWQEPQRFFEERSELAHALRRLAHTGWPGGSSQPAPLPDERTRRLAALARAQQARIIQLERQLAEACRPRPRRRRVLDDRQLALALPPAT
jgi:hypothetical protein